MEIAQAVIEVWARIGRHPIVALWGRQWQRRSRSDAALHPLITSLDPLGGLSAFHRAAFQRRWPRRGQSPESAVGDGAVPVDLNGY